MAQSVTETVSRDDEGQEKAPKRDRDRQEMPGLSRA